MPIKAAAVIAAQKDFFIVRKLDTTISSLVCFGQF